MKKIITRSNGTVRVQTINDLPSRTQQQFKDQCDVNNIIAKYKTTGEIQHLARKQGVYADVSDITDYSDSLNKINAAQNAFMTLPASTRLYFQNDPQKLLQFLNNPQNYDEGVKLGLYEKRPVNLEPDPIKNESNESKNIKAPKKQASQNQSDSKTSED